MDRTCYKSADAAYFVQFIAQPASFFDQPQDNGQTQQGVCSYAHGNHKRV